MTLGDWYKTLPVVTRVYVTLCFFTTAACALEVISDFSIYFNARLIFLQGEFWRLFTNFLFFGNLGLDFVFHMFFLVKYCKQLEEGSFRGRSADFLWMLLFGGTLLVTAASLYPWANAQFLGPSLTFMMVYVWGRKHPYVSMSFLGIFTFTAPYLPWVLLGFSVLLRGSPIMDDLLGICADWLMHSAVHKATQEFHGPFRGAFAALSARYRRHCYYFLEDVYPRLTGRRLLKTPAILKVLMSDEDRIQHIRPVTGDDNLNVRQMAAGVHRNPVGAMQHAAPAGHDLRGDANN